MIDKRVYTLICSRWIDLVLGCRPWSDLVAAKKHSEKIAVLKEIKKEKKHRQIRYKISREAYVCFFYLKSDKFTCAAEREDLPRPQYFVHIYLTKH